MITQSIIYTEINISWTNCTRSTDGAVVDSVNFDPLLPVLGQEMKVTAVGMIKSETVTNSSYYKLKVKFGFLTALDTTGPLCGNSSIDLPLGIGTFTLSGLTCPQVKHYIHIFFPFFEY